MTTGSDLGGVPASLTPKQIASLPVWRAYWQRMLCNTSPADRAPAEGALESVHRGWREPVPKFIWVASPRGVKPEALRRERETLMHLSVPGFWHDPFRWASLTSSPVWLRVLAALAPTAAGPRRWAPLVPLRFLQRLCAHGFLRVAVDHPFENKASRLMDEWLLAVRACGWFWRQDGVCWLCERPAAIHLDVDGQLHHPTGPAVRFRDGFELYYWHGTEVPARWVTAPEHLEPALVLRWRDDAQRAAGAEMLGWHRILEALDPVTVDKDDDPEIGELVEVRLPLDGPSRLLKVRCGTGRTFVLSVPSSMRTAREANAWTYGLDASEYRVEVRT